MRTLALLSTIIIATIVISITACENLFDDINDKYNADTIYMFGTSQNHTGNLGGRDGADTICQAEYDASFSYLDVKNVRAFINVSSDDEIRDMTENYGVPEDAEIKSPTNKVVDYNWVSLLDGSILDRFSNLGVLSADFWSGEAAGAHGIMYSNYTCNGWTDGTGGNMGSYGDSSFFNNDAWLYNLAAPQCNVSRRVVCIAW